MSDKVYIPVRFATLAEDGICELWLLENTDINYCHDFMYDSSKGRLSGVTLSREDATVFLLRFNLNEKIC